MYEQILQAWLVFDQALKPKVAHHSTGLQSSLYLSTEAFKLGNPATGNLDPASQSNEEEEEFALEDMWDQAFGSFAIKAEEGSPSGATPKWILPLEKFELQSSLSQPELGVSFSEIGPPVIYGNPALSAYLDQEKTHEETYQAQATHNNRAMSEPVLLRSRGANPLVKPSAAGTGTAGGMHTQTVSSRPVDPLMRDRDKSSSFSKSASSSSLNLSLNNVPYALARKLKTQVPLSKR